MVKKKGKPIEIRTRKRKGLVQQRAVLPLLEDPLDFIDNVNRMYDKDPWIQPWWNHFIMNQALGLHSENHIKIIPVDLIDTENQYHIFTELPGIDKKDIEITLTPTTISICGRTDTTIRKETDGYVKRERGYSSLCRYLRFPEDINPDNAEAFLNDGILQIKIEKKNPLEKKRVPINK